MLIRIIIVLSIFCSLPLQAQPKHSFKDFVELEPGRSVYAEYTAPQPGKPTLIVLNGLTYSTKNNDQYVKPLIKKGFGILSYDPMGMGRTLLRYVPLKGNIQLEDQVRDLNLLLNVLDFRGKLHIAGLSYGGGLALAFASQYPERVQNIIAMAPFTQALEGQDSMVRARMNAAKWIWPFNQMSEEELYEFFFRQIALETYPVSEPSVLENPYKLDAVMRMALGAKNFVAVKVADRLPENSLHLVISRQDQYIPVRTLTDFWQAIPQSKKASRLFISGVEHKLVEYSPLFAAAWTAKILNGEKELFVNNDFEGFTFLDQIYLDGKIFDSSVSF